MIEKMTQVLDAYPKVKGIQIMNDMGQYMFSQYAGKWIPDTPAGGEAILRTCAPGSVFSNSSPVEGITRAIRTFAQPTRRSASTSSATSSAASRSTTWSTPSTATTARTPRATAGAHPRHRLPGDVLGRGRVGNSTGVRFATLMRILCERNGGTFVGLNSLR